CELVVVDEFSLAVRRFDPVDGFGYAHHRLGQKRVVTITERAVAEVGEDRTFHLGAFGGAHRLHPTGPDRNWSRIAEHGIAAHHDLVERQRDHRAGGDRL